MSRILRRFILGSAFVVVGWSYGPVDLEAQTTFRACRVPGVGAIYMIGVAGVPAECLDAAHVEFSWTEGGAPADGSITEAKLANDAVTTGKIADGAVHAEDILDGAVTQAKLDPGITLGINPGDVGTAELADGAHVISVKMPDSRVFEAGFMLQASGGAQ